MARTILFRLLVGLVGYGVLAASFPFQPPTIYWLLGSTVALGLFSCIAFSASYQLVARFANENVIGAEALQGDRCSFMKEGFSGQKFSCPPSPPPQALGLGCSASGPLVLALQLAFGMGPHPSHAQLVLLYESIAVIVVMGLWAATSLLLRHWDAIEASSLAMEGVPAAAAATEDAVEAGGLAQPLLCAAEVVCDEEEQQEDRLQRLRGVGIPAALLPPSPWTGPPSTQTSASLPASTPPRSLWTQPSMPTLAHYNSLEPFASPLPTGEGQGERGDSAI